jgi:hypothetical protein
VSSEEPTNDPKQTTPGDAAASPVLSAPVSSIPVSSVPGRRDASGPAIAATAALVLFSVFIGVFGPRIGNRQQSPAGVTLVELAEAVVSRSQPHFDEARMLRIDGMSEQDFVDRFEQITEFGVALPSLEALEVEPTTVQRVLMPGGRGGFVVLRGLRDPLVAGIPRVASVAVLEDEDRFTVYDRYGRPIAMPEGEVFSVEDRLSDRPGTVEVYRDGDHVVAVHAQSREFARRIVAALQQAAARRVARGGGDETRGGRAVQPGEPRPPAAPAQDRLPADDAAAPLGDAPR